MTIPKVERVHAVFDHHVEVAQPHLLVVEPREVLRRVGIFIDGTTRQELRLLHADTGSAKHHLGSISEVGREQEVALRNIVVDEFTAAIERTCGIVADHLCLIARGHNAESFLRQGIGRTCLTQVDDKIGILQHQFAASLLEFASQLLCTERHSAIGIIWQDDGHTGAFGASATHEHGHERDEEE